MKVYIAGPMRGYPDFNFPAFHAAAKFVRSLGYEAISPAEHDLETWPNLEQWPGYAAGDTDLCPEFDFKLAIGWDLDQVANADAILMLGGWEASSGARLEHHVALATGSRVFTLLVGQASEGDDVLVMQEVYPPPPPKVIGLIGFAQVGKDTFAQALVEEGYQRRAFADALRSVLYGLNPMVDCFDVQKHHAVPKVNRVWSVQKLVDKHGWEFAKAEGPPWSEYTVRKYLQRLGTEGGREVLGDNVWVDAVLDHLVPGQRYVVTDVRFPNEVEAVAKAGGILIRITRPGYGPVNDHISEHALDNVEASLTIDNAGTIADLHEAARAVSRSLEGT